MSRHLEKVSTTLIRGQSGSVKCQIRPVIELWQAATFTEMSCTPVNFILCFFYLTTSNSVTLKRVLRLKLVRPYFKGIWHLLSVFKRSSVKWKQRRNLQMCASTLPEIAPCQSQTTGQLLPPFRLEILYQASIFPFLVDLSNNMPQDRVRY